MVARRVLVIGLDCVPPRFAFERYAAVMPHLTGLRRRGIYGAMRSSIPPITVPAWTAMLSGRDPGELDLYGFQQPRPGTYERRLVTAEDVRCARVWDLLGAAGKQVAVLFVPPSYPPQPVAGVQVSCLLTPDADSPHTYPPELQQELQARFGPYLMDVADVRCGDREALLQELSRMTRQHFAIASHVWRSRRPDFMVLVTIGPDRLHHAFYRDMDPADPSHDAASPFVGAGREYYALLDRCIGELLACCGQDCAVLVVSDHGARPLLGGICLNEWLIEQGLLRLRHYPAQVTPFARLEVDWSRTVAYGEGGYCGRIRLNLRGREPAGVVTAEQVGGLVERLRAGLARIPDAAGQPLWHRVVGSESYRASGPHAPELQVFFGDLSYRAIASVGHRRLHIAGDDRGPDGCNHDWQGIFVASGAGIRPRGELEGCSLYDVTPTVLGLMGVPAPPDLLGKDQRQ